MGFLDLFRKPKIELTHAQTMSGQIPLFSLGGSDIFAHDAVQNAIQCIASEMKKLNPQHVRSNETSDEDSVPGDIQRVLDNPNNLMTTSDFIEKVVWLLFLNFNCFIIPVFRTDKDGKRTYTGLYPIRPVTVDFEEDKEGELFVKFTFANSKSITLPYSEVIHLRYRFSVHDYLGGNEWGKPDTGALMETLNLNKNLLEGIAKAMNAATQVNAVVKYNTMLDKGKTEENLAAFTGLLQSNASGILPLDLKAEYTPINRDVSFVDPETVKFIDQKILRYFGVSLPILICDYTPQQYEAFYSRTLEPLVSSFSQAFTKTLFSPTGRSYGNKVVFYPGEMIFMTTSEKLQMVRLLGDSGALYENEKRRAFGLPPIPELVGVRTQSLNYVNSAIAENYQLPKEGGSDA